MQNPNPNRTSKSSVFLFYLLILYLQYNTVMLQLVVIIVEDGCSYNFLIAASTCKQPCSALAEVEVILDKTAYVMTFISSKNTLREVNLIDSHHHHQAKKLKI